MTLRAIPDEMSADAVSRVDEVLKDIKDEHGVHMPWAIESGSRAWGFPSPDSDYDGRFIFVRPARQLLTIWPRRDVIETPLIGETDVNGWDLAKTLRLLLKGNAVVVEWLQSPIIYGGEAWFRDALLGFAAERLERARVMRHYLSLGRRQKVLHLDGQSLVPLKKAFYALRPAAAVRWLRRHPDQAIAPMHLPTLILESETPPPVATVVAELIARKAETREMGSGAIPSVLLAFMQKELEYEMPTPTATAPAAPETRQAADALFAEITERLDGQSGTR